MQAQRHHRQRADADGPHRQRQHLGILGEDGGERRRQQLPRCTEQRRIDKAQRQNKLLGLENTVGPARAVVKAQNGTGTAGDAAQRHGNHQHKALGNGGRRHQKIALGRAAIFLQQSIQGNDHHIVEGDDGKGGEAGGQHPAHHPQIVAAEGDVDGRRFAEQKTQHEQTAAQLAENGGQRRTGNTHVQHKDEHRIQQNVQHRAQHHRLHALFGKALADDELVHTGGKQRKGRAQQIHRVIGHGVGQGGFACAKQKQGLLPCGQRQRHKHHRKTAEQQKAVGKNSFGSVLIARAHADAHQRRATHTHQKGDRSDHGHDRPADARTCQRQLTHLGNVSDVHPVHHAVQHTHKLRQHAGDGNAQHQLRNGVPPQIIFQFCGLARHDLLHSCFVRYFYGAKPPGYYSIPAWESKAGRFRKNPAAARFCFLG